MASTTAAAQVAKLKEEGNKLYLRKDYVGAHGKYSEAISLEGENAVLYANRGACALAMEKYLDAVSDCNKATKIDPLYTKAWARLGTALQGLPNTDDDSIVAFRRALSTLPVENLTQAEKGIKLQCETALKSIMKKAPKPFKGVPVGQPATEKLPWQKALQMERELQARGPTAPRSSAWVLICANWEFSRGMEMLNQVKVTATSPEGKGPGLFGISEGLQFLSNGIITDPRIFRADKDFFDKFHLQVQLEVARTNAFVEGGAVHVMKEAPKMLQEKGWEAARGAVTTTVRYWIMNAFMTDGLTGNPTESVQLYDEAIQVIEWVREAWRHILQRIHAAAFTDTFLRGVKCLRLECYSKAYAVDPSKFPLEKIREAAEDLLRDVNAAVVPSDVRLHPGHILSAYVYPKGQALAMLGVYHRELGKQAQTRPQANHDEAQSHFRKAAEFYLQAADVYPKDEEYHLYYLACAYQFLSMCGSSRVKEFLSIGEKMHAALIGVMRIWESSALVSVWEREVNMVMTAELVLRDDVETGRYTLESQVEPMVVNWGAR